MIRRKHMHIIRSSKSSQSGPCDLFSTIGVPVSSFPTRAELRPWCCVNCDAGHRGADGAATLYFPPNSLQISTLSYQPDSSAWVVGHATQIRKAVGSKGYGNTVFSQDDSQILKARATRSGGVSFFFFFLTLSTLRQLAFHFQFPQH